MFTETMQQDDAVVGLACAGKLSVEDLKRMHALLHERLAARPRPGLVVDLRDFAGYESLSAVLEDVKMDMAHRNDFSRIAVIGNRAWMEWGSKLVKVLTSADIGGSMLATQIGRSNGRAKAVDTAKRPLNCGSVGCLLRPRSPPPDSSRRRGELWRPN